MVLMDQAIEDVGWLDVPGQVGALGGALRRRDRDWDGEVDAAVRSSRVVVPQIGGEDALQVMTVPDQCPVQTLGADGAHPTLGVGVGLSRQSHLMSAMGSGLLR